MVNIRIRPACHEEPTMDLRSALINAKLAVTRPEDTYRQVVRRTPDILLKSAAKVIRIKIPSNAEFVVDPDGHPVLMWSIFEGEFGMVRFFLEEDHPNRRGETVSALIIKVGTEGEPDADDPQGKVRESWNYIAMKISPDKPEFEIRIVPSERYQDTIVRTWICVQNIRGGGNIFLKPIA